MKRNLFIALTLLLMVICNSSAQGAAQVAPISGEIEFISINNPNDHWSGGKIVVGGQNVIIPRNLLMDLPANRLTLKELFEQAPASCVASGETGLAKGDTCNSNGVGGFASISANITNNGNIIAGDILIDKGLEALTGKITYISYTDGYFRINGTLNDPTTGVMVRLNDPDGRHTVQQGLGCLPGSLNCSPDPRFTLDPDNYTNIFSTGYPLCIPSTISRTFTDTLNLGTTTAQSTANGTGDVLCPTTNRTVSNGLPVDDSRRLAPIMIGDSITAEGNFETVNGVRFLSAHSTMVGKALTTKNLSTQPDYLFLDEVEVDAPGFQNQRARTLIIGYATKTPTDILIWSLHYDPITNEPHEFPLATVQGCDTAAGAGTCGSQGLVNQGTNIFKIRHDIDFLVGADPKVNICAHLQADPRMGTGFCPNGGGTDAATSAALADQMGILSPIMHEIIARTGQKFANPELITLDIRGNVATNGEYLFPFGMNLGGVSTPEMNEIDLNALATPLSFSGIPWLLDRRLSPGGCLDTNGDGVADCESTPQPLDPFPYEGIDPRTQANLPTGTYNDPHFTASPLSDARNRVLSYVNASGNFNGNSTILAWPPADPPLQPITVTPQATLVCTNEPPPPTNTAPSFTSTAPVSTPIGILYTYDANAIDSIGDTLTYSLTTSPTGMTINSTTGVVSWTPSNLQGGSNAVTIRVTDQGGLFAQQSFTITVSTTQTETIAITRAEYDISSVRWIVRGTTTLPGSVITAKLDRTGQNISTTTAGSTGSPASWNIMVTGSGYPIPQTGDTVTVRSTNGAIATAIVNIVP